VAILAIAVQFVRPARTNPPVDPGMTMDAALAPSPQVTAVLDRACADCHSNRTRWPWYSEVAPVSWFVAGHVRDGRRHFNMSEWTSYDEAKQRAVLGDICKFTSEGVMPLGSYLWGHSEARLAPPDVRTLCEWTSAVRAQPALVMQP
jgi:hypothetical protein